jgi:hypothetical protein
MELGAALVNRCAAIVPADGVSGSQLRLPEYRRCVRGADDTGTDRA